NGNSRLHGALFADRVTLNGGAVVEGLPLATPEQAPALLVRQRAPGSVLPGQTFGHTLTITNTASVSATQVLVQERFVGATPLSATATFAAIGAARPVSTTFIETAPTVVARQPGETAV